MATHKIRTTIKPGVVLTVGDAEFLDLTRQGLILPDAEAAKLDKKADTSAEGK